MDVITEIILVRTQGRTSDNTTKGRCWAFYIIRITDKTSLIDRLNKFHL